MSSTKWALRLSNVSKAYGRVNALKGFTVDVPVGRFFALFGPSAVGKTTALRTIAGLVRPDSGRVELHDRDVTQAPIAGRDVSMVFQSFALFPHLTVFENLAYPLREQRVASAEIKKRVTDTAAMLKLSHRLERKPSTLSGGEQQRVALGRSLIRRPKILLLDEPLTNLDAKLRHDMRAELKRLHRQFGMTIVYATPDELEALSMGEEIAVMRDGAIVQQGTPDQLYERPINLYVAGKIGSPHMNTFEASIGADGRRLDTPFGALAPGASYQPLTAGDKVVVGVRPSDIRVLANPNEGIPSSVQLLEPLGDVTILSVATAGPTLRVLLPEQQASSIRVGDALAIGLDGSKLHLFRGHDGSAIGR